MRFTWEYFVAVGAAVVVALLAWFSGSWFHLVGFDRGVLSIGILIIGAAAIIGFLLWARAKQPPMPSAGIQAPQAPQVTAPGFSGSGLAPDDINLLVREAEKKVASARLGHGAKLFGLRQIFILGDAGSGKTTVALQSGLEPELLAGQVFQEGSVVPTATANFWFARKSVLVEPGSQLLSDPRLWMRLVRRLSPGGFRSAFSRKSQGERAAVVCFDCEKFGAATSSDSLVGTARSLHARLAEMSQVLGSSVPVYVVFTKADRMPFFEDFVARFTNEEGSQVFGVTIPIASDSAAGVYAERESKRLTTAFNTLFYSLADHRLGLLSREQNQDKRPDIYEYPREFSKVAKRVVQFLVELGRPSQLRAGPFLRGFYFTGMHTVASASGSQTMLASRTNVMAQAAAAASNATTILRQEDLPALSGWESGTQIQSVESRKIPQWVFLSHIFSHIVLEDHSALGASAGSARSDVWRRILLAGAGALALVWILGSSVSYFSNRALERDVLASAQGLRAGTGSSQQLGLESLQQLDALRKQLQSLENYTKVGAPWHLRWGLYSGDDVYPDSRRIYFDRFRALMFGQIQASMTDVLRRLPAAPGPNDEYGSNYDVLKAYLITTSNPDRSTAEFLSPVLQRYLAGSQTLDASVLALARAQFDFYAGELKVQNPYSSAADTSPRDHARAYLNRFGAVPRIYAAMQNAASRQAQAVNFYRDHPDATDVLRLVPEVPGVFSKAGWDFMQNAIAHSDQYFHGEDWVLGGTSEAVANRAELESQIRGMYEADYIAHWQDFLKTTHIAPYGSLDDSTRKLKKLSANESPLLQVICYASLNTAGRSQAVDKAFKPVQQVVPPACENRLVTPLTTPYVAGLAKLEYCLESVATAPPDQKENQRQQCNSGASEAKLVVATQIVPAMDVDPQGHIDQTVRRLLEEPIGVPAPPPPQGGNAKGVCDAFGRMSIKYPFNPYSDAQDATIQEFDEFFRPGDGVLAKFTQTNQPVLALQGVQYMLKPGARADWGPAFFSFLSRAHSIQQTLYPTGAGQPQYKFTVRAVLPEGGITGVSFTFNGQTLRYPGSSQTATFVWPGSGVQEARISYRAGGGQDTDLLSGQGLWSIIRILSVPDARVTSSGSTLSAEWHPLQADRRTPLTLSGTGRPIIVHLDFDTGGAPFIFQSGTFSNLACRAVR